MSRLLSAFALVTVLGLAAASAILAAEKPAAKKPPAKKPAAVAKRPPSGVGEAAIEKALAQPTEMDFDETPLSDVIDDLKKRHHIEIQLDNKALADVGIDADTPVTKNIKGITLRSALRLLVHELNLTYMILDEVLLITTPEEAESQMTTNVLDVSDLVVCRDKDDELWDDYDTLIDSIDSAIMPTTWDQVGGPGSITGASLGTAKVLIVRQTHDGQCQIADLLEKIRAVAKKNPDGELPQRNKSTVESTRIASGFLPQKITKLLADIRRIARDFPDNSTVPKPSK